MRNLNPGRGVTSLAAAALLFGSQLTAGASGINAPFDGQYSNESPASQIYKSGSYGRIKEKPQIAESVLLSTLDKEGRGVYYSLDPEGKKLARQLAAESARAGEKQDPQAFRAAVNEAVRVMAEKTMHRQDRMLHNGMDRLSGKRSGM